MTRADLTVTIPEGVWIGDITREHPDATVRILAALAGEGRGVALAEVEAPDCLDLLQAVADADAVAELEVFKQADDTALVEFETTVPLLLLPIRESGIPLETPFEIREGQAAWELTAPRHRLSELGDRLSELGIPFTVEQVGQHGEEAAVLTDRQARLIGAAVREGYYDVPRACSLTELADAVGIAKSTCSETLHRAEAAIVREFVDREGPLDDGS